MAPDGRGRVRVEQGAKRVRVMLGGEFVADSRRVKLVWEQPDYPTYYFPADDVRTDVLVGTGGTDHSPSRGDAAVYTVKVGDHEAESAASWYTRSPIDELDGTIRLQWDAMDAWLEEDEKVFVHPRLLFETSLPVRYYLPKTDVRMDLLTPTEHRSHCPYKGTAEYYSLEVHGTTYDNLVWWYRHPTLESVKIAGYVCFYNERVDLYVDGELQPRPRSPFS